MRSEARSQPAVRPAKPTVLNRLNHASVRELCPVRSGMADEGLLTFTTPGLRWNEGVAEQRPDVGVRHGALEMPDVVPHLLVPPVRVQDASVEVRELELRERRGVIRRAVARVEPKE